MRFPYSETVLDHFRHPRNVGKIENPDGKAIEGSPACGDMVAVYISVDSKTNTLSDIKFESYGCASNIATGSIITELAKGKTLDEAKKITWQEAAKALGGLPKIKAHCSVLAVEGLRSAIENYKERHGLVKEKKPTTVETVLKRLRKVMNPLTGLDLVRTNLVRDIEVKDGTVRVVVDLPENHQFAPAIKEEITEKIEPLWDVKEVTVEFVE
jgi:nitrogen fixation protein NifU and related proteins